MAVSLNGYKDQILTFIKDDDADIKKGDLLRLVGPYTVNVCESDDEFMGICESVDGDLVGVKVSGFATLRYTGSDFIVGYATICCSSKDKVRNSPTGKKVLVVENIGNREISILF